MIKNIKQLIEVIEFHDELKPGDWDALRSFLPKLISVAEAADRFIESGYAWHKIKPLVVAVSCIKKEMDL